MITERHIDSDTGDSEVANDGSGAEDNGRDQVILADNPRPRRTLEVPPIPVFLEPDETIPCLICKMLLNGKIQYEDHLKGKVHRRKKRALRRSQRALPNSIEDDEGPAPTEENDEEVRKKRKQEKEAF